ncbi:hypothetical protein DAPPUDRAFT_274571 [Daphnia pulex]|uniref:Uncharacterized protein n=1 Tax=Daphnia pulex TaxID=6669 RepID=E9I4F1_DAPPU|nr:hypothetical protein DAPPUDRAFT_274571 [Daphnia pulex]|eukprot:EFX61129.1 hypothetical protein DAPPUDRAFT_274571 [Daphnia pulex]
MESSQEAEENWKTAVEDFKKITSVCCEEPEKIWGDWVEKAEQKGELTSRLLRLCIALRAREEGLEILKILGRDFKRESKFHKYKPFEGIKSEKVSKAISDFISQVTGKFGRQYMGLIKKMTSPHRVIKQLAPMSTDPMLSGCQLRGRS